MHCQSVGLAEFVASRRSGARCIQPQIREIVEQAAYRDARLELTVKLRSFRDVEQAVRLEAELLDPAGESVLDPLATMANVAGGEEVVVRLDADVTDPLKWSAETPHLYTLLLTLKDGRGLLLVATPSTRVASSFPNRSSISSSGIPVSSTESCKNPAAIVVLSILRSVRMLATSNKCSK